MFVNQSIFYRLFLCMLPWLIVFCRPTRRNAKTQLNISSQSGSWKVEEVPARDLVQWQKLGTGRAFVTAGGQTCLEETDDSEGVMLVSPGYYGRQVAVRYQFLLLSPATVMVTLLSAKDTASHSLTIPEDYKGAMSFWTRTKENYFFVFRNAPHGGTPYITRNPGARIMSTAAEQDRLQTGIYYDVEIGRNISELWVIINGKITLKTKDVQSIAGGHIAVRVRGTAGHKASALVKDVRVFSK